MSNHEVRRTIRKEDRAIDCGRAPLRKGVVMTVCAVRCTVFDRIVCAFDGSEPSLEAARQAHRLRSDLGSLEIDSVFEPPVAAYSPYGGPMIVSEAERSAAEELAAAKSVFPDAATHLLHGTSRRAAARAFDRARRHPRRGRRDQPESRRRDRPRKRHDRHAAPGAGVGARRQGAHRRRLPPGDRRRLRRVRPPTGHSPPASTSHIGSTPVYASSSPEPMPQTTWRHSPA